MLTAFPPAAENVTAPPCRAACDAGTVTAGASFAGRAPQTPRCTAGLDAVPSDTTNRTARVFVSGALPALA